MEYGSNMNQALVKFHFIEHHPQGSYTFGHLSFLDLPMSNSRTFSMNSQTFKIHPYFRRSAMTEFLYMFMIRNIDLYVQIPGLSRTSTKIPELSRPGIQIFKFQDFPGFQGPVQTLTQFIMHITIFTKVIFNENLGTVI